ncbi:MAG: diadenylate cyclase CdaA [Bacteroidales bacterium]|nr:diadenylate cyclase CdaA [Bacteroidales bacterium]MCF8327266.1 diadenylate cyclase CdaA [Bacteroidales bacterium]
MAELMLTAFIQIRILDIIDILLVAYLLYALYNLIKGTAAINIFVGIIAFYLIWQIVKAAQMELLSEILGKFISVGVLAVIIVFQQEIRKFLLLMGTPNFINRKSHGLFFWRTTSENKDNLNVDVVISACQQMANQKIGALIVVTHKHELEEVQQTGIYMDAEISSQLIVTTFYGDNPLHDGAIIIHNNRIQAARCILPVSRRTDFPSVYGLRHRAALGVTEQTDASAIIVSEQTGEIAYAHRGRITPNLKAEVLKSILEKEFKKD